MSSDTVFCFGCALLNVMSMRVLCCGNSEVVEERGEGEDGRVSRGERRGMDVVVPCFSVG